MKQEKIRACLCHLGYNMWADPEEKDGVRGFYYGSPAEVAATPRLRFRRETWDKIVSMLCGAGCNMIVLDIGEGIRFDCAPELAAEDAWTKEEMKAELSRLRSLGFEVIPKLNFSTCHDEWLGIYSRMVSTPPYYEIVKKLISETAELFDRPRFFHIGMDEEGMGCQKKFNMVVIRQGELWWHDFNYICDCVREAGCRPWMWADYLFDHEEEFLARMPKDVLMSYWYYGNFPGDDTVKQVHTQGYAEKCVRCYELLHQHGFEQIPGTSNWDITGNLRSTVKFCEEKCSGKRLLGYLQTVWYATAPENLPKYEEAIGELAELTALLS